MKKLGPKTRFEYTGKFGERDAGKRLSDGGKSVLLAIRDMGGEVTDCQEIRTAMCVATKLPPKGMNLVLNVMVQKDWLLRVEYSTGTKLILTDKGLLVAEAFQKELEAIRERLIAEGKPVPEPPSDSDIDDEDSE